MTIGLVSITNANTIKISNIEINELEIEKSVNLHKTSLYTFFDLTNVFQQISFCAQVQMDVKETYTEQFGPDRANSIALGAFMGCMGYL